MNNLGNSTNNYHIGDVEITEDLQVDGNFNVDGTTTISGPIVIAGDLEITPPGCLLTDCIEPTTVAGDITVQNSSGLRLDAVTLNVDKIESQSYDASNNPSIDLTDGPSVEINATSGTATLDSDRLRGDQLWPRTVAGNCILGSHDAGGFSTQIAKFQSSDKQFYIGSSGNEYSFPTTDGSTGQILKTDGAGALTFQDVDLGTARIVQNKFTCSDWRTTYTKATPLSLDISTTGSKTVASASEWVTGSQYRVYGSGNFDLFAGGGEYCTGQLTFIFGAHSFTTDNMILSPLALGTYPKAGRLVFESTWTRVSSTIMKLCISGGFSNVNSATNQPIIAFTWSGVYLNPATINPYSVTYPFNIGVTWTDNSTGTAFAYPQMQTFLCDYMNPSADVIASSTTMSTTDHLLLTNLDAGTDGAGGHSNMFVTSGARAMGGNIDMGTYDINNTSNILPALAGTSTVGSSGNYYGGLYTSAINAGSIGAPLVLGNSTDALTMGGDVDMNSKYIFNLASSTNALSFYEYYTDTPDWTGPWAIDQAKLYEIVRVGRAVTFVVGALSSTSTIASIISIVTAIPTRFRPGKLTYQSARVIDGSSNVDGFVRAQTTGVIEIGVGSTFSNFQNSGNAGWHGLSITWII